jgi:hypothetical protein
MIFSRIEREDGAFEPKCHMELAEATSANFRPSQMTSNVLSTSPKS